MVIVIGSICLLVSVSVSVSAVTWCLCRRRRRRSNLKKNASGVSTGEPDITDLSPNGQQTLLQTLIRIPSDLLFGRVP